MDIQIIQDRLREMNIEKVHVKGQNVMCVCPFHPDRNPSFGIHPSKGGNCFACNTKFPTADITLEQIAKRKGLPYVSIYEELPFDYDFLPEEEVEPEPLNPNSLKFYKKDIDYFVEHWNVGQNVVENRLLCLDTYNNAECFPIFDSNKNYWGNVERYPPKGNKRSWYHYPPNLPKHRILLGEDKVEDEVWIVEGVRDLCAIETKIGSSAVAIGGAKVSDEQLEKIDNYENVVLALDNDRAGRMCRDYLLNNLSVGDVKVAKFNGKDPMEATDFDVRGSDIFWLDFSPS